MDAFREQGGLQLLLKTAADTSDTRQQRYPSYFSFLTCFLLYHTRAHMQTALHRTGAQKCVDFIQHWSHRADIMHTVHRKALQLLRELVRQRPQDIREAVKDGLLGTLGSAVGSDQADVREAALALLALLVQHPGVIAVAKQVLCAMPSAPCSHLRCVAL